MGATVYSSSQQWADFDENRFPIPGRFDSLEKPRHLSPEMGVENGICSPVQNSGDLHGGVIEASYEDKYLSSEEDLSGVEDDDGNQDDYLSADGDDDDTEEEGDCVTREDIANQLLKSCRLAVAVSIIAAGRPRVVEMRQLSQAQRSSFNRLRQQQQAQKQQQAQQRAQKLEEAEQWQASQATTPVQLSSSPPHARTFSTMSSINSPHRLSILSFFNSHPSSNSEQTETTKRSSLMSGFSRSNRSSTISTSSLSPDLSSSSPPSALVNASAVPPRSDYTSSPIVTDSADSPKFLITRPTTTSSFAMNVTSSPATNQSQTSSVPSVSATRNRLRNAFFTRLGAGGSGIAENKRHLWRARGTSDASPSSVYSSSPSPSRSGGIGFWRPSTSQSQSQPFQNDVASAPGDSPSCDTPFRLRLPSYITEGHENGAGDEESNDAGSIVEQRPSKKIALEIG